MQEREACRALLGQRRVLNDEPSLDLILRTSKQCPNCGISTTVSRRNWTPLCQMKQVLQLSNFADATPSFEDAKPIVCYSEYDDSITGRTGAIILSQAMAVQDAGIIGASCV